MKPSLLLSLVLLALTLLRWASGALRDLAPQEAYLALCGYAPAWAYFDGPPGTAIGVAQGVQWAGAWGLGAALFWPLFAVVATLALYFLVRPLLGTGAAVSLSVLLNLLPAFNRAALTADSAMPVTAFSLLYFACAWRGLQSSFSFWWLASGLAAAGALLFSYHAWLLLPALALVLVSSHRWRRTFLAPGFWLSVLPALGVLSILLLWNREHGWVHFIGGTWQTAATFHWSALPGGLKAAVAAASPLVLLALFAAWVAAVREVAVARKAKFLVVPAALALVAALYAVLQEAPTETPGLLALALSLPLLGWLPLDRLGPAAARWAVAIVFVSAALWTATGNVWRMAPPPLVNAEVAGQIATLHREQSAVGERPLFLIARDARLAAILSLYLPDTSFAEPGHPPVYVVESPHADSQYALWPRYDQFVDAPAPDPGEAPDPFTEQDGANPFVGRSALYITPQLTDQLPQAITAAFAAHRLLAEITTPSGEKIRVYLCEDYETLPL